LIRHICMLFFCRW